MKHFDLKIFLKIAAGVLLVSAINLSASNLPVSLGPPLRISPIPGPANPDPILQNLQAVMDDHYQPPYYPGVFDDPAYLSNIYFTPYNYIVNNLIFNPCNDQTMLINLGQNLLTDYSGTFLYDTIGTNVIGISSNKGASWNFVPPVEQIIPLGGTISQIINASLGPGLYQAYTKNGRLDASGWGFFDMRANPPNSVPTAGFLFSSSFNNAQSWNPVQKVLTTNQDYWFTGPPYMNPGLYPREFYVTADPSNPDLLHAGTMYVLREAANVGDRFSSAYYMRSEDAGKNFTAPVEIYNMINDPLWQSENFDAAFVNSDYLNYGGRVLLSTKPIKVNDDVLIMMASRTYPAVGSPTYTGLPPSTVFDQAAIRSLDNGKTWEKIAAPTPKYLFPNVNYDPGFVNPFIPQILEGQLVFPGFSDGVGQGCDILLSPTTGRIYISYTARDPASFATINRNNILLANSSSDLGKTWSNTIQANATPRDISFRKQQCFCGASAVTLSGQVVYAYYDFRNWTGTPGENLSTTPLQMDAWLAIYDETEDPNGGSTGIGLDFVGEIRLSPVSSNVRLAAITPPPGFLYSNSYLTGTPEGITLTVNNNNELFVAFSMTNPTAFRSNVLLNQYKGMTIDTNSYNSIMLSRFKFPNSSNN